MGQYIYHKQVNPAAIRSQKLISDALIRLMRKKHFSRITVTEICKEADIGRKTFYRNFEMKEDVIDFQLDALYEGYFTEISRKELENCLHYHFSFLKSNMEYLTILYRNDLLPMLTAKFARLLPKMMPVWSENPVEQKYRSAFIAAGIDAILFIWAESGFEQSVDEVVEIAQRAYGGQLPIR